MTKIFVAIDTPDLAQAAALVKSLSALPLHFKLGLEFFTAQGPAGIQKIRALTDAEIFLDLKLHDIPNTVAGAARAVSALGVDFLTVHASGGKEMMRAAVEAADKTKILAVTVLTSLEESAEVLPRARSAMDAGVAGVVCSPQEIALLKKELGINTLLVVPGIRLKGADRGDQKRVMTPQEAAILGADYLVIGRPITQALDPVAAAREIVLSLAARAA